MKIKELEWDEWQNAETPFEYDYEITFIRSKNIFVIDLMNENACSIGRLPAKYLSQDDAKQASQEDFERRIMACFEED